MKSILRLVLIVDLFFGAWSASFGAEQPAAENPSSAAAGSVELAPAPAPAPTPKKQSVCPRILMPITMTLVNVTYLTVGIISMYYHDKDDHNNVNLFGDGYDWWCEWRRPLDPVRGIWSGPSLLAFAGGLIPATLTSWRAYLRDRNRPAQ